MTPVWTEPDGGPPGPRTHVFVVGVGHYRHMPGGAEPVRRPIFTLSQVDMPPHSAAAVVDHFADHHDHPAAPLGSIEATVSRIGGPATVRGVEVEPATLAGVRSAFLRWKRRCGSHPGNVAVFVFCGHGVEVDNHYLLLEDFAADDDRPMANSIDLDRFHQGMDRCPARTQLFLVDACREAPWDLRKRHESRGDPLIESNPDDVPAQPRDAPLLRASAPGQKAFGRAGEVTYFTAALLTALRGAAALEDPRRSGQWVVRFHRLLGIVNQLLLASGGTPQHIRADDAGDPTVARLRTPPAVPLRVVFTPDASADVAEIELRELPAGTVTARRDPAPGPWSVEVPARAYALVTAFTGGAFTAPQTMVWVSPPDQEVEVFAT